MVHGDWKKSSRPIDMNNVWSPVSPFQRMEHDAVFLRNLVRPISALFQRYRCIFLGILFFTSSCAGTNSSSIHNNYHIIDQVSFYSQEAYQCGPASIAGVLNYWDIHVSAEEIATDIYSKSAKGTLDVDMVLYARKKGLKGRQYSGSMEDIRLNIDSGYPIIVLVDYGFWICQRNHFMVIVGYDKDGIIANTGRDRLKFISNKNFMNSWEKTDFWTLIITPKN